MKLSAWGNTTVTKQSLYDKLEWKNKSNQDRLGALKLQEKKVQLIAHRNRWKYSVSYIIIRPCPNSLKTLLLKSLTLNTVVPVAILSDSTIVPHHRENATASLFSESFDNVYFLNKLFLIT